MRSQFPRHRATRRLVLLAGGAFLGGSALRSWGADEADDAPVVRIRSFYAVLLDVMKQAKTLGVRGRYAKLAPAIQATFDLAAMTRIAVGPDWTSLSAQQQASLIEDFGRMTIATYANRFDGYAGEQFVVDPTPEPRNTGKIVRTKLIQQNGEPVTLNYLLRSSANEAWKIVDVYLTGTISELATRRAEFGAILKSGGPQALERSLRQQTDRLLAGT